MHLSVCFSQINFQENRIVLNVSILLFHKGPKNITEYLELARSMILATTVKNAKKKTTARKRDSEKIL